MGFWNRRRTTPDAAASTGVTAGSTSPETVPPPPAEPVTWWQRLRTGLQKTRARWGQHMAQLLGKHQPIDPAFFEALETQLLQADLGWDLTDTLVRELQAHAKQQGLTEAADLMPVLQARLIQLCTVPYTPLFPEAKPRVVVVIGVNGVGKTTTIGKLASRWKGEGQRVMLAAGDTFRAAAIEQLKIWADRIGVGCVAQQTGSDAAAVVYDAFQSAQAKGMDVVIADTAGRLHNKAHLMQELHKIKRVLSRLDPHAPHDVWLVLDATIGQNAVQQVAWFHEALPLTGLVVTKLDGTAKAGVIFQLCDKWKLPVHFIGVGETESDFQPFDPTAFVHALLGGAEVPIEAATTEIPTSDPVFPG